MRAGWSRWGCGLGLGLLGLPALARAASPVPAPGVDLWQVFVWSLLPVAATLCAILVALTHRPSAGARSALQHLAAGIVFAAVATEIVPEMLVGGHVLAVASGFAAGVALMFGVRVASDAMSEASSTEAGGSASGWSMLMATGIDLAIDGLLIGLGFAISTASGVLLTLAVAFEVLFVSLGLSATLADRGRPVRFIALSLGVMALLTLICTLLGASLLSSLEPTWKVVVLSFGSAALLYLVSEELLVEAHADGADSVLGSMLFFVGFGASLVGSMLL